MSSTLILVRGPTTVMELRRGTFEIVLDGQPVGAIDRHRTVELPVDPGSHTLQVKAGRYSSPTRTFAAADGTAVAFRCDGAILWPRYLVSLPVPNVGLKLTPGSARS